MKKYAVTIFATLMTVCMLFTMVFAEETVEAPKLGTIENPITIENNEDFAKMMQVKSLFGQGEATVVTFINAHKGDVICFDGYVGNLAKHGSYNTRFDVLLCIGDAYDASSDLSFQFYDVNFGNMNVNGTDTVRAGMNFTIVAEIVNYNENSGLIRLKPVEMTYRK